jgi:hypothetical protein
MDDLVVHYELLRHDDVLPLLPEKKQKTAGRAGYRIHDGSDAAFDIGVSGWSSKNDGE